MDLIESTAVPTSPVRFGHESLRRLAATILVAAGTEPEIARSVANHLVEADLCGHGSHGVAVLPVYLDHAEAGLLELNARPELTRDSGAILCFDGRGGFGSIAGRVVMDAAIRKVAAHGLACVALRNTHHLGRIGVYGEHCARAGHVSMHFVNVVGHDPLVAPWGGRERRLSTNPLCIAVPRGGADPIVLDMATSAIAYARVRAAHASGVGVPEHALIDSEGRPSTDPNVMFQPPHGALRAFGLHKGYGLALMCELLGGALAAQWTIQPEHARPGTITNNMLAIVVDPAALGPAEQFAHEVEALASYVVSAQPASDSDRVRLPGQPEQETRAERLAAGIPLHEVSWCGIVAVARRLGVEVEAM